MMTLMLLNWITVMVVMLKVMRRTCYGGAGKVALLRIWPGLAQTSYVTLATWLPVLLMVMNIWYALISIAAIGKGDDEYEVRNPIQRCNGQKILFPRTRLIFSSKINLVKIEWRTNHISGLFSQVCAFKTKVIISLIFSAPQSYKMHDGK